mmetsp:Transcript_70635/g.204710  ORF Transcript_70635/g.204710 Transcript_70635/m.204710 type:complete len:106 (+) Transcript_70635:34-351(+)
MAGEVHADVSAERSAASSSGQGVEDVQVKEATAGGLKVGSTASAWARSYSSETKESGATSGSKATSYGSVGSAVSRGQKEKKTSMAPSRFRSRLPKALQRTTDRR